MELGLPVLTRIGAGPQCVWVDAGVLNYRLCNRGFACETCPLDAAIRNLGRERAPEGSEPHVEWSFPSDRMYAPPPGHLWVQMVRAGRVRMGLDACAARLMSRPEGVVFRPRTMSVVRGDPVMDVWFEGGELVVGAPAAGRVCDCNTRLEREAELLSEDPYGAGWIAEMRLDGAAAACELMLAAEAKDRARLEARRFGRMAACALLTQEHPEGTWIDPRLLEATRRALGGEKYVSMLREMLGQGGG